MIEVLYSLHPEIVLKTYERNKYDIIAFKHDL